MHGHFHVVLRRLVVRDGGDHAWMQVLDMLDEMDEMRLLDLRQHDDSDTMSMVNAARAVLKLDDHAILYKMGQHFVEFLLANGHMGFVRSAGSTIPDLLLNLAAVHAQLVDVYKMADFPQYQVEPAAEGEEGEQVYVSCTSVRGASVLPLTEGILTFVARLEYKQALSMTLLPSPRHGADGTWRVTWRELSEAELAECEAGQHAPTPSAHERRAAATWHTAVAAAAKPSSSSTRASAQLSPTSARAVAAAAAAAPAAPRTLGGRKPSTAEGASARAVASRRPTPLEPGGTGRLDAHPPPEPARARAGTPLNYLNWRRQFHSAKLEAEFRAQVQARVFAARAGMGAGAVLCACVVLGLHGLASAAARAPAPSGAGAALGGAGVGVASAPWGAWPAAAAVAVPTAAVWLCARSATLAHEHGRALELGVCAWLCLLATLVGRTACDEAAGAAGAPLGGGCASAPLAAAARQRAMVAGAGVMVLAGNVIGLELLHLALVLCAVLCANTASALSRHRSGAAEPALDACRDGALFVGLLGYSAQLARARLERERVAFWNERTMASATEKWRELKELELDMLLKANARDVAAGARSRLIRVVMHDLRSPLLSVVSLANMLTAMPAEARLHDKNVVRAVSTINTCTRLMENIVSDMLDFERIDSGRLQLVRAPFTLATLLSEVESVFAPLARNKGVEVVLEPPQPELLAETRQYLGDLQRLVQCLGNGMSNATKFTDAGGEIRLRALQLRPPGPDAQAAAADSVAQRHGSSGNVLEPASPRNRDRPYAHLSVQIIDDGAGLCADDLAMLRAGRLFQQVGLGQMQGRGGTGLGLTIARQMLKLHGDSKLTLHSEGHNRGTTFEVLLKLPVVGEVAPAPRAPPGSLDAALVTAASASGAPGAAAAKRDERSPPTRSRRSRNGSLIASDEEAAASLAVPSSERELDLRLMEACNSRTRGAKKRHLTLEQLVSDDDKAHAEEAALRGRRRSFDELTFRAMARARCGADTTDSALLLRQGSRGSAEDESTPPNGRAPGGHAPGASDRPRSSPGTPLSRPRSRATSLKERPEETALDPGARLLHVEDDPMLQFALQATLLEPIGIPFDVAGDGAEALRMLRERARLGAPPYTAVLLDNQMPNMSGAQAASAMRAELGYAGLIIGITGDPIGSPDRTEFEGAGLDACVDKTSVGMAKIKALVLHAAQRPAPAARALQHASVPEGASGA